MLAAFFFIVLHARHDNLAGPQQHPLHVPFLSRKLPPQDFDFISRAELEGAPGMFFPQLWRQVRMHRFLPLM